MYLEDLEAEGCVGPDSAQVAEQAGEVGGASARGYALVACGPAVVLGLPGRCVAELHPGDARPRDREQVFVAAAAPVHVPGVDHEAAVRAPRILHDPGCVGNVARDPGAPELEVELEAVLRGTVAGGGKGLGGGFQAGSYTPVLE